jgi:cell division protein FtsW
MVGIDHANPVRPAAVILIPAMLMVVGLVMVGSATASLDRPLLAPRIWTTPFGRQAIFMLIGLAIMLLTARVGIPLLASPSVRARFPQVLFVLALALLAAALVPGLADPHRGSHRWLHLGRLGIGVGFQPSELAKLALVAFLASLFGERSVDPRSFGRAFLPATLAIGVCVGLVGKENFGTAVLLACAAGAILFVAGCRRHHLLLIVSLGAAGLTVLLFAAPYRLARITAYRDFWGDPQGDGYQPLQSLVTIASGGWWGTGLGSSVQKYGYLPESHTDFVFAVLCEELGVFGGALVILLFCAFVWLGIRTMLVARTRFERLLAFGLTFLVALQAAMNIAVVTVMTPTTGVPLPMLSAGGSGMFTVCAAVGLLAAVAHRTSLPDSDAATGCASEGAAS